MLLDSFPPPLLVDASLFSLQGGTVGYIGTADEGIIGLFCVSDQARPEARHVIHALRHEHGIEVHMMTGDSEATALSIAKDLSLPLNFVRGQLSPQDKLVVLQKLKEEDPDATNAIGWMNHFNFCCSFPSQFSFCEKKPGLVLMCGDGMNDAPAFAISDVSVAMGNGAALAKDISDVTLMDSDLRRMLTRILMGRKVLRTIVENIVASLMSKLAVIILMLMGHMSLFGAIASDVGIILCMYLNIMKLLILSGSVMGCCKRLKEE